MKHATRMQPRRETRVNSKKEGAAIRQDTRSTRVTAYSRRPRPSVAQKRADDRAELSLLQVVGSSIVGVVFLFAFMWLAAAY